MPYTPSGRKSPPAIPAAPTELRLGTRIRVISGPVLAIGRIGVITGPANGRGLYPCLITGEPLSNGGNGYMVWPREVEVIDNEVTDAK